jgi:hypothetical protein
LTGTGITFSSTTDATSSGSQSLSITDAGTTIFSGGVGGAHSLSTLMIVGTSGGSTDINGGVVKSTGTQTYNNPVLLSTNTSPVLTGVGVSFNSTIDGSADLTVSDSVTTTFAGRIGNGTPLKSISTDAAGNSVINTDIIKTTGAQNYYDNLTFGNTVALPAGSTVTLTAGSAVSFGGTVGGANNIVIIGNAVFGNGTGDTVNLTGSAYLSVSGASTFNTSQINTAGAQTYTGAVTLGAATNLSGVNIRFSSFVDGGWDLTVTDSGTTSFLGKVGNTNPLTSLTTDVAGITDINGGLVKTTGTQRYNDVVVLSADTVLTTTTAGSIIFGQTVDSQAGRGYNLTLNTASAGVATFTGAAGS